MTTTKTQGTTLVLGATGKTGRRVTERLWSSGIPVRPGSRSGQPPFDWDRPETWQPALDGVESVYVSYQPELAFPGAAETVKAFAKLAVDEGVRKLVLLSGRGEPGALAGEQAVRDAGAEWTIVRASFFFQNFSESEIFVEPIRMGEVVFPAGEVREPFIDADDIADVAAAALLDDKHAGRVYEVTGPRLMTFGEAIAEISRRSGRSIRYQPVSIADYRSGMIRHGVPAEFARALANLLATILDGRNSHVTNGVEQALGRPPRDFSSFAIHAAANGDWAPATLAGR